jgi:hypothetical protein
MTPIYNAATLRKVSADARLAEYNRIKNDFVPAVLCKMNEANFAAANAGFQSAADDFNLLCMGLSTEESQNYLKIGLKSELEELGFSTVIKIDNGMLKVMCTW